METLTEQNKAFAAELIQDIERVIYARKMNNRAGINYHAYFHAQITNEQQKLITTEVKAHFVNQGYSVSDFFPANPGIHVQTNIPENARYLEFFVNWQ